MSESKKSRISKLEEQMAKLEEKLKRAKARESERERKADNKRKFLLGAMLQSWMAEDEPFRRQVEAKIDAFLTRASDRRYFGLTGGTHGGDDEDAKSAKNSKADKSEKAGAAA